MGEDGPGFSRQSTLQNIKDFTSTFEIMGDKTQHTFARLPERIGSGHSYDVTIVAITMSQRVDKNDKTSKNSGEICSLDVTERFMTRPLAPTNVRVGNKENPLEICWMKSMTPSGTYNFKLLPKIVCRNFFLASFSHILQSQMETIC